MTGTAIVAIPNDRDAVWKYSSEKVPHMTLLFLGEQTDAQVLSHIEEFLSHVAINTKPFGMNVESRGKLGPDKADVLFFTKDRHGKAIPDELRRFLLTDPEILKAYNSIDQYPEWNPHLTMGYPATPAKKDDREYPGFGWIEFDKVALWVSDFDGPTFKLNYPERQEVDMVMNDRFESFLEHHGIKGMHWGRRKADSVPSGKVTVDQKKPGTKVQAAGGKGFTAHPDAVKVAAAKQVAKRSTTDALSTQELQQLVLRMNLEQQYSKLSTGQTSAGRKFVNDLLLNTAKQQATKVVNDQAGKLVSEHLKKAASRS
jgi:2'-5' RNA ligase